MPLGEDQNMQGDLVPKMRQKMSAAFLPYHHLTFKKCKDWKDSKDTKDGSDWKSDWKKVGRIKIREC